MYNVKMRPLNLNKQQLILIGNIVTLRLPTRNDYEIMGKIFNDPKSMAQVDVYNNPTSEELEQIWRDHNKKNNEQKALRLMIHINTTKEIVGCAGFGVLDLHKRQANYGIILDHHWWCQGIAEECLSLCYNYAFSILQLKAIDFTTKKGRGTRLLEKAGFELTNYAEKLVLGGKKFTNVCTYSLIADNWLDTRTKISELAKRVPLLKRCPMCRNIGWRRGYTLQSAIQLRNIRLVRFIL